ncbi:MAG: deoxyhypusine synthase family protein [Candidatus Omnitrophica bacterium]|nr:deoxyhypusine synthase family protein [Candidatus Omnitrophota bacterium]MCM8799579.1 deoxyhypusine synthase family protein [Candidatus Omnitrophota bacterium]
MIELDRIKRFSLKRRRSKVNIKEFASPPKRGIRFLKFYNSLPLILKVKDIKEIVEATVKAKQNKKPVIFMCGAHVIKCGLNPVVIELIKNKIISCLCFNGAGIIHDFEIAFCGKTSEDVASSLEKGMFGMAKETADFINNAIKEGVERGLGLGNAVAEKIAESSLKYKKLSILFYAYKYKIPVCVFVAIGTDVIHQHPSFDASLTAEGSKRDFYKLVEIIKNLEKGVVLNFGSAVIMPEVFLKALNLARNLGYKVKDFISANFDMIYHYRPDQNLVKRPHIRGGKGYYLVGHHEIMLPFLAQAIIEKL